MEFSKDFFKIITNEVPNFSLEGWVPNNYALYFVYVPNVSIGHVC